VRRLCPLRVEPGVVGQFDRASDEATLGTVGQPDLPEEWVLSALAQRLTDKTMTDPESLRHVLIAMYQGGGTRSRTRYRRIAGPSTLRDAATAVPGATSAPAHRLDTTLMTPPLSLAARSSARSSARPPS
jgi:hypothetical protein